MAKVYVKQLCPFGHAKSGDNLRLKARTFTDAKGNTKSYFEHRCRLCDNRYKHYRRFLEKGY